MGKAEISLDVIPRFGQRLIPCASPLVSLQNARPQGAHWRKRITPSLNSYGVQAGQVKSTGGPSGSKETPPCRSGQSLCRRTMSPTVRSISIFIARFRKRKRQLRRTPDACAVFAADVNWPEFRLLNNPHAGWRAQMRSSANVQRAICACSGQDRGKLFFIAGAKVSYGQFAQIVWSDCISRP